MGRTLALTLAVLVGSSVTAAPAPQASWGKAGISLEQYRKDSLECGLKGYYSDISKTDDAKAFVTASRQLDTMTTGASAPNVTASSGTGPSSTDAVDQMVRYADQQQHIVDSARPNERFHNIKKTLVSVTEQCLAARGYSKFELTDEQRHTLKKLKAGSDQRRAYLYSLATSPEVLASQKTGQP
jgi:hypothetical protein